MSPAPSFPDSIPHHPWLLSPFSSNHFFQHNGTTHDGAGKKPILAQPTGWYEPWVWSPEARKPWIRGSQVSQLAHCGITPCKRAACQEGWPGALRGEQGRTEAKPGVVRQMWWEFRCLNSRTKRGTSHFSPIWSLTCAHCREGVGKTHFKG